MTTPTIQITKRYDTKCSACPHTTSTTTNAAAEAWAAAHEAQHAVWTTAGRNLTGLVFDTSAPHTPWFGYINDALAAATTAGYAYIAWNGWVYHTDPFDFDEVLCMTSDVPGLTL